MPHFDKVPSTSRGGPFGVYYVGEKDVQSRTNEVALVAHSDSRPTQVPLSGVSVSATASEDVSMSGSTFLAGFASDVTVDESEQRERCADGKARYNSDDYLMPSIKPNSSMTEVQKLELPLYNRFCPVTTWEEQKLCKKVLRSLLQQQSRSCMLPFPTWRRLNAKLLDAPDGLLLYDKWRFVCFTSTIV